MSVHPTAVVEDGASLAAGVEIGPFCHVGPEAVLEEGVRLRSHVSVTGHTKVGRACELYPGVVLGGDGQIRNNTFTEGRLEIGAGCVLREMVSMNVGSTKGGGLTRVGAARLLHGQQPCIGHDCRVGADVTFANSVALGGHVGDRRRRHIRRAGGGPAILPRRQGRHGGRAHRRQFRDVIPYAPWRSATMSSWRGSI